MKIERVLQFARSLMEKAIQPGDIAVDSTLGNGHDTLFLANLVGESGKVYGFDIQEQAILKSKQRLAEHHLENRAILFHKGHEHIQDLIPPDYHGKVTAAIFNLGYLPGSDKSVVTKPDTTIAAIEQLLQIMASEGIIVLVIYHGHPEGATERDHLLQYVKNLDQQKARVLLYQFLNQQNDPPFIVAIEKI
ncbi:class I SAM-dependent methyltransferase [Bacillus sp. CGMCC 1.16607]|uniref:class I SAM-dependent methyltransferase n=1 Tax=Bacillus sp. CGMCC 1.16607 TaxID=3351842 RepID=UPI0036387DC4